MAYENSFQRANPGLIIFLVDQSGSMDRLWSNGRTLADNTACSINMTLNNMILKLTDAKGDIKKSAYLVVIGYGKDNNVANIIVDDWINEIGDNFETETTTISTLEGDVSIDCIKVLEPKSIGGTPMASAFKTAKDIVEAWISNHNSPEDPSPVVINISDGEPTDGKENVIKYATEIKTLAVPDGNTQVFNIHLSPQGGEEIKFPRDYSIIKDSMAALLFEISSDVSPDLVAEIVQLQGKVVGGEKLFMSNVQNPAELTSFLQLGTKQSRMQ